MNEINPRFSIVIPTYERPKQLKKCLDSVSELSYPVNGFEVVVVDDGSPSALDEIVDRFRRKINIKLIKQHNAGPATARNRGAEESSGRYLAFTDDDCKPCTSWLTELELSLNANPELLVAGRTINDLPDNPYSTASQLIIDFLYSYFNRDNIKFIASNNMALSREQFHKVGGFDTAFPNAAAEDREFCDRHLHYGFYTYYAHDALVLHSHPLTLGKYFKQHFNYGRGAQKFHKIRAQRNQDVMKIEPIVFYKDLLIYPWKTPMRNKSFLSFLFVLSQMANASGYFAAKINPPHCGLPETI